MFEVVAMRKSFEGVRRAGPGISLLCSVDALIKMMSRRICRLEAFNWFIGIMAGEC